MMFGRSNVLGREFPRQRFHPRQAFSKHLRFEQLAIGHVFPAKSSAMSQSFLMAKEFAGTPSRLSAMP